MKRFFYLSVGLFFLALTLLIGFHVGARTASADFDGTGMIVGADQRMVLLANGEVWEGSFPGWKRWPEYDPPMPLSEIKFWNTTRIVTTSDELWRVDGTGGWVNLGFPGGTVAMQPSTWGGLKNRYTDKEDN